MKRLHLILFFIILFIHPAICQKNISDQIRFIDYLTNKGQYDDALILLKRIQIDSLINNDETDSIHYLEGICYYNLKRYDQSANQLINVSHSSSFYYKSIYFSANTFINLRKYDKVEQVLNSINTDKPEYKELKSFQLAGSSLLKRDFASYDSCSKKYSLRYYPLVIPERRMDSIALKLEKFHPKSPALAGVMSTILPGSGKIYAGKPGQGVSSFLIVGILGAVTIESYLKKGIWSPRTILFGSLFSVYYVGNIWGSIHVAADVNKNFYHEADKAILFNLYIPLHTIFD